MEFVMRSKEGQEFITSPFSGCPISSKVFVLWSITFPFFDTLIQTNFGFFQKLQLVIYAGLFMMS